MKQDIEKLRKKYIDNPPEGMTSRDIRHMSGDELLDMDYFLNEDDLFDDEASAPSGQKLDFRSACFAPLPR